MSSLARELRLATQTGAALALLTATPSCGGQSSENGHSGGTSSQGGSATANGGSVSVVGGSAAANGGSSSATGGHDGNPPPLAPYAASDLGCVGETHNDGYYGQCCFKAHCYDPAPGSACASATDDNLRRLLPHFPPGSGSCTCSVQDRDYVSGPFAMNPDDTPLSSGQCCYIVGSISCEGRPLVIEECLVLAAVVVRSDWALDLA